MRLLPKLLWLILALFVLENALGALRYLLAGGASLTPQDDFGWPTLCDFVPCKGWVRSSFLSLFELTQSTQTTYKYHLTIDTDML